MRNKLCLVLGMFLETKCVTGHTTDKLAYEKFSEDWSNLKFEPPLCNQGLLLPHSWLLVESGTEDLRSQIELIASTTSAW